MNEPEYEYTFDASDSHDVLEYACFLWARTTLAPTPVFQRLTEPAQQEEKAREWYSKQGFYYAAPRAIKRVPKRLLLSTGTKASDWTQGQGTGRRKPKTKGTSKGSRKMEVRGLPKDVQSYCTEGYPGTYDSDWDDRELLDYLDHYHDA